MNNNTVVFAGIRGKSVVLRIGGKATWQISSAIKAFEERFFPSVLEADAFFIDLTECISIDSTIIGLICHQAVKYSRIKGNKKAVVWIEQERVWGVFELMNCDRILDTLPPPPPLELAELTADLEEIKIAQSDEENLRAEILKAHTALSSLNTQNEEAFSDVVADLQKKKGPEN